MYSIGLPGIYKLDTHGTRSLYATGLQALKFLAVSIPEPSSLTLLFLSAFGLRAYRRFAQYYDLNAGGALCLHLPRPFIASHSSFIVC